MDPYKGDNLTDRQKQIAENMRFYADVRFKQVTLLFAWLAIAGAGIVHADDQYLAGSWTVKQAVAACSILITAVLWVYEVRAASHWYAHRNSPPKVPNIWPSNLRHSLSFISGTNMTLGMFVILYFSWVWLFNEWRLESCLSVFLTWLFGLIGGILVIFSVLEHAGRKHSDKKSDA